MSLLERTAARLERTTGAVAHHLFARALPYVAAFAALTAGSVVLVSRLELKSDFIELLPQDYQSVRDLRLIIDKVGGVGNLSIAIESSSPRASQRFADDVAAMLQRDFADRIRSIDYKTDEIERFYREHAALYMDEKDLVEIQNRLQSRLDAEKREKLPLFADILDPDERPEPAPLELEDIRKKYERQLDSSRSKYDGYYMGEDGHLLAMLLKPRGGSTDMPSIKRLIGDLDAAMARLQPSRYAPDLHYEFAGSYTIALEEYETLKKDILGTALLCIALVSLAIFVFFRRFRAVLLLGVTCVAAVMWAFAITELTIGYLNTVTAFLGAIIAGTGINYGIIQLARYFEERRLGHDARESMTTAMRKTVKPTFAASATTAVAFGVFGFADVKSFSQFGFIGAVGVLLLWIGSYTLLPALMALSERIWPSVSARSARGELLSDEMPLGFLRAVVRHPRAVLAVFAIATAASIVGFALYVPGSLEYDISRLRTKSSIDSGTAKLDHRISKIFPMSMTPAVLYAGSPERAREVCDALYARKAREGDAAGIERCRSISSFLPKDQDEKLATIAEIRRLTSGDLLKLVPASQRKEIEDLRRSLPEGAVTLADLPPEMTRYFIDKDGNVGTFVYVDPRAGRNLWNAENLLRFTQDIRRIELPSGEVMTSSGEAVIFADLLDLLKRDSPRATVASFLGVFLVVLLIFRGLKPSIYVASSLLAGTFVMLGLMALFDVKINFFNFMALPMTFGIGVDYSINFFQRYLEEGKGGIEKAMRRTGTAVLLCSLTTIIGYAVLIVGDSRALVSLGMLAILGELTCLAAALVAMPALLAYREARRS